MSKISNIEPRIVWQEFDRITQIPRPSKKEQKIRAYLRQFAADHNLSLREDAKGNIVIIRPASAGREAEATLILQSHVDMVCERDPDRVIDFENDPIEAYVDGEWVKARGTTLGADCGIGMSLQMAVLTDPELTTPTIEALFTVDEEQGLTGAQNLDPLMLTGSRLINLDSEDEGEIYIGCAGGIDTLAVFNYTLQPVPSGYTYYNISVGGLHGGHSGDDIEKGFACSNKLLTRLLWRVTELCPMVLVSIDGGNLRNAIARDARAVFGVSADQSGGVVASIEELAAQIKAEFSITEPEMSLVIEPVAGPLSDVSLPTELTMRLLEALCAVPHGVLAMSRSIEGLVESSTNLASVKMVSGDDGSGQVVVTTSQRSSVESAKRYIATQVASAFHLAGARVSHSDGYPGWPPNPDSELVRLGVGVYRETFGQEPQIKAIHAGLECGLFLTKYPSMDMISIGPTLRGVHSPAERILIPSVAKTWKYLRKIIQRIS